MAAGSNPLRRLRIALWVAVVLAAVAFGVLWSGVLDRVKIDQLPGAVKIGGPFTLTAHTGETFDSRKELVGKAYAIVFGFTNCPDVCPTTLLVLANRLAELGPDGDKLRVLFVTVDPERDTAKHLADYVGSFDKRIVGLTGTAEQISAVARSHRVIYEKVAGSKPGDYTMNHTATVFVFDAKGDLRATFSHTEAEESQKAKIRRVLGLK